MDTDKKVLNLNLDDILPNRFQPRIKFDENAIKELSASIKEHGVIQPIIVRKIGDKYEIIAGERRYKASVMAGNNTIPAIITDLDDKTSAEVALIENVQREDLTPIEEAVSYRKILDMGLTQEELANKLDRNQSTIANKLRLLNLDEEVQEALLNERISERHARSLLKLSDPNDQRAMLQKIMSERLTVRKTDEAIDAVLNNKSSSINSNINALENGKEEVIMNNNTNNNIFNIPSEPIINDVDTSVNDDTEIMNNFMPLRDETVDKLNLDENKQEKINPGFMDVDKIEEQAQDIYTEKPTVNIDELLQSSNNNVNNNQSLEIIDDGDQESSDEFDLQPGKFFNFAPEHKDEPIVNKEQEKEMVEKSFMDNNFNNDFVNEATPIAEKEESKTVEEQASNMFDGSSNFNDFFNPVLHDQGYHKDVDIEPEEINIDDDDDGGNIQSPIPEIDSEIISTPELNEIPEVVKTPVRIDTNVAGDLKTVINTIRSCAQTIEKYGFVIDTEELDFEDSYQVIFRIEKKK